MTAAAVNVYLVYALCLVKHLKTSRFSPYSCVVLAVFLTVYFLQIVGKY